MKLAALCFLAMAQLSLGQTISGKVTDAITHLPIAGAAVSYCCERVNTVTSAEGVYSLLLKPDGAPGSLRIAKPGYATLDTSSSEKVILTLAPGASEKRDFEMNPAARISGRLLDADTGKPIVGYKVAAISTRGRFTAFASSADSGPDGSFTILSPLTAGAYILEVNPTTGGRIVNGSAKPVAPEYARSWYSNATREDLATPITVGYGENRNVEIRLQRKELRRITGTIQVPEGMEKDGISVVLTVVNGERVAGGINLKPGPFRIESLDTGTYVVFATTGTGAMLNQTLEVGNRDVENVKLILRRPISIRATVTVKEEKADLPKPLLLFPIPSIFGELVVEPSDTLKVDDLPPGRYWPALITGPGYAVISATYGGRPVTASIDAEATESTVEYVVTSRPASITGVLRDGSQRPVPEAVVYVVPEVLPDPADRTSGARLTAQTDSHGAFRIGDLPPGRYRAGVLDTAEVPALIDWHQLSDKVRSDRIDLDFGQTERLDLHVK